MKAITRKNAKARAAANKLADLAKQGGRPGSPGLIPATTENGKRGLPDEPDQITLAAGKPRLSEPEPEPEYLDYSEEDVEGEDEEKDEAEQIDFTEKDRKDLPLLEQRAENGGRQQAEAIREIRQRQLWRLILDDEGKQLYSNFEDYCQDRLGHPRQWVTHLTNWLRILEEMDRLGIKERLTVKAAQGLLIGRLQDAGGLRAVLEEAKEDSVPLDRDHLREIVLRRADFNYWSQDGIEGITKPAATTYAEYKKDLAAVKELGDGQSSSDVVTKAKALDGDLAENIVAICKQERTLPRPSSLLAVLTGTALQELVRRLKDLGQEQVEITEKKARLKELNQQLREGQKKEREEKKALEQELKAKGVLKVKAQPPQGGPPQPPSDTPPEVEEDVATEPEPESEVYMGLQTAWKTLDEALSGEWPEEEGELNAVLLKAQECEDKLAEVVAKAKELIADAEQPEAIPSGND
jgi:hypothetical protein